MMNDRYAPHIGHSGHSVIYHKRTLAGAAVDSLRDAVVQRSHFRPGRSRPVHEE
jgi:hypothetical protein